MEMDEETRRLAEEVGTAINESVQQSASVAAAIERLREAGFEMELTLKLEIGLRPQNEDEESDESGQTMEFTEEDLRILRSMKIKIDPEEG
jgi:DNA primase